MRPSRRTAAWARTSPQTSVARKTSSLARPSETRTPPDLGDGLKIGNGAAFAEWIEDDEERVSRRGLDAEPLLQFALTRSGYNSFHVEAKQRITAEIGASTEAALIEDFAVRLEPQEQTDTGVKLLVTMIHYEKDKDGKRIARVLERATMTIRKGKFLLRGGWGLKKGVLITLVAAE